ncbi:MAG: sulfatase/phosphatase domain-containing protein, partial [Mariniblastus sp.]
WGKVMLFETCDRVPLIVRVPDSIGGTSTTPGSSSRGLVELVDLFPTLGDLCGISVPEELQGRSLRPMLSDPQLEGKKFAYTVVSRGENLGRAIRTQRYRYTTWLTGEELYDLQNDPLEETNLANLEDSKDVIDRMRRNLIRVEKEASAKKR